MLEAIYKPHYSNGVPAMLPLSVVQLKGKHCGCLIPVMAVAHAFQQTWLFQNYIITLDTLLANVYLHTLAVMPLLTFKE